MANRDVNLIIRAKNQASKSLDAVSGSLKNLKEVQSGVAASASKTDSAIGSLSDELQRLRDTATSLEAFQKAKGYMETAAVAVGRLKTGLAATQDNLKGFGNDSATATSKLTALRQELANVVAQQKQEKTVTDEARQATLKKSEAVRELARAQSALASAQAVKVETEGRDAGISSAKVRLDSAETAVAKNVAAYQELDNQLQKTNAKIGAIVAEIKLVERAQSTLSSSIKNTTQTLVEQKSELDQAEAEYGQISKVVGEAAKSIGVLDNSQEGLLSTTANLVPAIERLGSVVKALQQFSSGNGSFVDPKTASKMQELRATADATKDSWKTLEAEAVRLREAIRSGEGPTAAMTLQLRQVIAAAAAAKKEYNENTDALHRLGASTGAVDNDLKRVRDAMNGVKASSKGVTAEVKQTTAAMGSLKNSAAGGALGAINRESRQAMSVFQRLRGEVLSLGAAYIGLYGTISNVGGVLTAYQKMEAAQNRLGAVFAQNEDKIGAELQFLQAQASRLGIEFGSLADQYSKFAVSAQAANFTTEQTRKVFISVAEAGRVNKLSLEDMNGVFLALTQMIQKGRVSSEELRQQLGERLPGAVNIFADALGVGTDKLSKMLEQGEVLANSDTLLKFADELNKRFGPQLSKALLSTTTQLGRFKNNIFGAQLGVASGGFIESFNRALEVMNTYFESREGRDFFLGLGSALGKATDGITYVLQNLDLFGTAIRTIIALKFASWATSNVQSIILFARSMSGATGATQAQGAAQSVAAAQTNALFAGITRTGAAVTAFSVNMVSASARARLFSGVLGGAGVALAGFSFKAAAAQAGSLAVSAGIGVMRGAVVALRVSLTALGGPLGILITLASIFAAPLLTGWATEVDTATLAADEHLRIMQEIVKAYQDATDKTADWAKSIKNVSVDQLNVLIRQLREESQKLKDEVANSGGSASFKSSVAQFPAFDKLSHSMKTGKISAAEFVKQLEELYSTLKDDKSKKFIEAQLLLGRKLKDNEQKLGETAVVAREFGSTLEGVAEDSTKSTKSLNDLGGKLDETVDNTAAVTAKGEEFRAKLAEINEITDKLNGTLETLKDRAKLDEAFAGAVKAAKDINELRLALAKYNQGLDAISKVDMDTALSGTLVDRIIGVESGGNASAKNPTSSATGLGQFIESTWLRMFKEYFPDRASSLTDAAILELRKDADTSRKMVDLYLRENAEHLRKAGVEINDANLYLSHFLGPGGAAALIKSAPGTQASDVLSPGQVNANQSVLAGKTREEVIAWAQKKVGIGKEELAVQESIVSAEQTRTEELRKQSEATSKALADLGFENDMLAQKMAGKEREVFIEEQLKALKEQNPAIDAASLARAKELLGNQYDMNKALDAQKDKGTEIEQVEKRINDLETKRSALLEQQQIYKDQGNTEKLKEVETQLVGVNAQLTEAVNKAVLMYQAIGGEGSDAAIAKLQTLGLTIESAAVSGSKFAMTQQQMTDSIFSMLDSGVIGIFDSFAQAIANGENALKAVGVAFQKFAAEFLIEIGKMILKQIFFNLLQKASGFLGGGLGKLIGTMHTGGIAGSSGIGVGSRSVSPGWFAGAARYHTGGIAGLAPNEVPAILKAGEEVLTANDPRHARNGGRGSGGSRTKIVNTFDAASFLSESLKSVFGEEVILNYVRANPNAFKQAMEG